MGENKEKERKKGKERQGERGEKEAKAVLKTVNRNPYDRKQKRHL